MGLVVITFRIVISVLVFRLIKLVLDSNKATDILKVILYLVIVYIEYTLIC